MVQCHYCQRSRRSQLLFVHTHGSEEAPSDAPQSRWRFLWRYIEPLVTTGRYTGLGASCGGYSLDGLGGICPTDGLLKQIEYTFDEVIFFHNTGN